MTDHQEVVGPNQSSVFGSEKSLDKRF